MRGFQEIVGHSRLALRRAILLTKVNRYCCQALETKKIIICPLRQISWSVHYLRVIDIHLTHVERSGTVTDSREVVQEESLGEAI